MIIQKHRTNCISCGKALPEPIVFIGEQYPSAIFVSENDPINKDLTATSLDVTRCENENCNLVQLCNEYDLQYVFDHYPYESGSTATMQNILQNVVDDALSVAKIEPTDVILDIGGNDGTLLSLIAPPVRARVNIDAASGVDQKVTDPNYIHVHDKFNTSAFLNLKLPNPRIITSVAMFYHLNDPLEFCRNVADIMDDNTIWLLQMTYLGTMLEGNIFDNIVHEHTAYYSLSSLEALLSRVGLHIAEARIVESYGGSIRVHIVKDPALYPKEKYRKEYTSVRQFELDNKTNTFEALYAFNSRTNLLKKTIRSILNHLIDESGPVWGFGASTKGNMLLQFLDVGSDQIPCILDNSQKKIGKYTTGSMIPIIDERVNLECLPKYLFVLPYYYVHAFVEIIRKKLRANQQVHLFVPLPQPYFITLKGI